MPEELITTFPQRYLSLNGPPVFENRIGFGDFDLLAETAMIKSHEGVGAFIPRTAHSVRRHDYAISEVYRGDNRCQDANVRLSAAHHERIDSALRQYLLEITV